MVKFGYLSNYSPDLPRCRSRGIFLGISFMKKLLVHIVALFLLLCPQLALAANAFLADSKIKITSIIVANNTTAVVISTTQSTVYSVDAFNNAGAIAYVKLYNASTGTCGTGTPQARYMIPFGASSSGGGFNVSNINGDAYANGIVMCITTGIADTDIVAPSSNAYIVNIHYKN